MEPTQDLNLFLAGAKAALAEISQLNAETAKLREEKSKLEASVDSQKRKLEDTLDQTYNKRRSEIDKTYDGEIAKCNDKLKRARACNGSYFELERCLNFWKDSQLKDLSAMIEYDGATWGAGIFCFGANYFLHSDDFKNTFNLALLYDCHVGYGDADTPIKFSGVWGCQDIFGVSGLRFSGFIDIWGNNQVCTPKDGGILDAEETHFSILTEPQLWYNIGQHFGCQNLNIGGEVEISCNFAGVHGWKARPCIGAKWVF